MARSPYLDEENQAPEEPQRGANTLQTPIFATKPAAKALRSSGHRIPACLNRVQRTWLGHHLPAELPAGPSPLEALLPPLW